MNNGTKTNIKVAQLHQERGEKYGAWQKQALVSQAIKEAYKVGNYDKCTDQVKEKLDMIANKLSRILNGDQFHEDSWDNIAGYATLPNEE